MSKNSKKTINVRTHNPFEIYNHPNNHKEEFAGDLDSKPKDIVTNKNKNQQSNKKNNTIER
ncbi:MAG: hypothetical protein WBB47_08345 [Paenisporosarcina sp.]